MERKVMYNYDFKLRYVREVLKHRKTVESVSLLNGCHNTTLHDWIRFYEKYRK